VPLPDAGIAPAPAFVTRPTLFVRGPSSSPSRSSRAARIQNASFNARTMAGKQLPAVMVPATWGAHAPTLKPRSCVSGGEQKEKSVPIEAL
jgi:hypothetical protein